MSQAGGRKSRSKTPRKWNQQTEIQNLMVPVSGETVRPFIHIQNTREEASLPSEKGMSSVLDVLSLG